MGATLATLDAVTKEIYEPPLREQLNNDIPLLNRIEKSSNGIENTVGGRYVTFPIHVKRNSGIGARGELQALPTPGQQGTAAARVSLTYLYGGVQLSGQAIDLIDKNYQAFVSSMDLELNGLREDLKVDQNRQIFGTSVGKIGSVTTAGGPLNTFVVDRPDLFQEDEIVDYVLANDTIHQTARKVTAIDLTASTITIDGAAIVTVSVGDYLVRTGNQNKEWIGLSEFVSDTGIVYNVNPATVSVWKSVINTNGGVPTAVSEGMITKLCDDIRMRGGGNPTVLVTSPGVRRAYANLLMSQRQYVNTKEFTGGFSGLAFVTDKGEIPIMTDDMAPKSKIWAVNEKNLTLYRESDWRFMDRDGSRWQRVIGFDAYSATMVQYSQLGIDRRNAFGAITNIIEE